MHPLRDLAIVLKSVAYEERHRIVSALTERHGQITAIAKNCIQSRRFGGTLDTFVASEWIFHLKPGSEIYVLTQTTLRESFEDLRQNFQRLSLASLFNEIVLRLNSSEQTSAELFRLHSNALFTLSKEKRQIPEVYLLNAYFAKVLHWSGNQPLLKNCLRCHTTLNQLNRNEELICLIAEAGWVCPSCQNRRFIDRIENQNALSIQNSPIKLSAASIEDLQKCFLTSIKEIGFQMQASVKEHESLFRFLEAFFIYHIPGFDQKPLKSLRFLGLGSTSQCQEGNPPQE